MRTARLLPAAALLLVPALLVAEAGAQPSSPSERAALSAADGSTTVAARVRQRGTLTMHPQLSQAGSSPAGAGGAKSSMTAAFKPAKKGRKVVLQRRKGRRWVTLRGARRQNGVGVVEFNASYRVNRRIPTYRALAVRFRGLPKKATNAARTDRWGNPDFTDEFAASTLDPSTWSHRGQGYNPAGRRQCSKGDPRATQVGGGTLRLSVMDDPGRNDSTVPLVGDRCDPASEPGTRSYNYRLNGHVSTADRRSFLYGYAAARMRFQPSAGQHASFWLQPQTSTEANPGAEIDVIEWFGNRTSNNAELTSFVYHSGNTYCGRITDTSRFGSDWASKYHVFSVEWTPTRYTFRIDGKKTCSTTRGISRQPEYLILSLLSSDYELPLMTGSLPQHMYVDWVRFWDLDR